MKRATAIEIDGDYLALMGELPTGTMALCAMQSLPALPDGAQAPEWVQLLPKGPQLDTYDSRGPYSIGAAAGPSLSDIVRVSKQVATERGAVLDENHSTDVAAPQGQPSPASGWFTDFEARDDGIWGKVDWTGRGKGLMSDRAYRGISPVIIHDDQKRVLAIVRASLINKPNLKGLHALNQESDMDLLAKLIAALKLKDGTSEDAVMAAVTALQGEQGKVTVALQGIAKAAGLAEDATGETILGAIVELKKTPAGGKTVEALQAELNQAVTRINELEGSDKKKAAIAFVDKAIGEKAAGVSARRDEYISLHMENPTRAESIVAGLPRLNASHTAVIPPKEAGKADLTETDKTIISMFGIKPEAFAKTRAAEGQTETAA